MELTSRAPLMKEEQFEIASTMHAMVLDRLFSETHWLAPQAVFHGGTALSFVRDSQRFSEDLDFMVTPDAIEGLDDAIDKVRWRVDLLMAKLYPGGRVTVKGPKGDQVTKWEFKWEHPGRRGKVMVKAEFLVTRADLLAAYRTTHMVPTSRGAVGVSIVIPVPDLVSAKADKIKAIATRPDFKWRDAFDLAWIARCLKREDEVMPDEFRVALGATASIYDKTLEDVAEGLSRVLASGVMDDVASFEADMTRWFPDEDVPRYRSSGYFRNALAEAKREVERSLDLIREPVVGAAP